jgi:arylformamidase
MQCILGEQKSSSGHKGFDQMSAADIAYQNAAFIPGGDEYRVRWAGQAASFRMGARGEFDIPYGSGARQGFDLFQPTGTVQGVVVFIHGGYWMAMDRKDFSHLAAGPLARGWAVAMPSYTLAPEARIGAMTAEIFKALQVIGAQVLGPMVVTGHSAGGHLAARMGNLGGVQRVVPISPLADLGPLMETGMNATLRIDAAEVAGESPAFLPLRTEAHVWVGGQERPAFLWQARTLAENWGCSWTVAPGRHHFDVIEDMCDAASALVEALVS